jgi:hypothetical protein
VIPFDLATLLRDYLTEPPRNNKELYASIHLNGSLRHAMLDVANAPRKPPKLSDYITLKTGDLWHDWIAEKIRSSGLPFMNEVRLNDYLPEGWRGRADWVIWNPEIRGFVLGDLKTITGEGLTWVNRAGAKDDHIWQVSAYWHALYDMGLPMLEGFFVFYWPKNAVKGVDLEPSMQECNIIDRALIHARMGQRWDACKEYLDKLDYMAEPRLLGEPEWYLTDQLAPPIERLEKVAWNAKQKVFDLKLVPHWTTAYCPFEDQLCDCSTQGTTKVGHYDLDGNFVPRKGYEDVRATAVPTDREIARRRREVDRADSGVREQALERS